MAFEHLSKFPKLFLDSLIGFRLIDIKIDPLDNKFKFIGFTVVSVKKLIKLKLSKLISSALWSPIYFWEYRTIGVWFLNRWKYYIQLEQESIRLVKEKKLLPIVFELVYFKIEQMLSEFKWR